MGRHLTPSHTHAYTHNTRNRSDSHSKQLFRALQCFLIDFWDGTECAVSANKADVDDLNKLPTRPGESKCFNLAGDGRVCFVHAVLGTSLVDSKEVCVTCVTVNMPTAVLQACSRRGQC